MEQLKYSSDPVEEAKPVGDVGVELNPDIIEQQRKAKEKSPSPFMKQEPSKKLLAKLHDQQIRRLI